MHCEEHGTGGTPLVLLHGGMAGSEMYAHLTGVLSATRRVRLFDLPGHGRSPQPDGPYDVDAFAEELAGQIDEPSDVVGYSLGGEVAFRLAVRHPEKVRRLTLIAIAIRRADYLPDVLAAFDAMGPQVADMLRNSPVYAHYREVAPDPEAWDAHVAKTAALLKQDFDWSEDVGKLPAQTTLVFADADIVDPVRVAGYWKALGGGLHDAGVMGDQRPQARLAILPGHSHYDLLHSPLFPGVI
jgi:pimeloyl-ACP methyl ester carboxylesterase